MTREEAINAITQFIENYAYGNDLIGLKMAIEALKERPHGEWVEVGYTEDYHEAKYRCTKCKTEYKYTDMVNIAPIECFPNFCPKCGADMRKEGDEK